MEHALPAWALPLGVSVYILKVLVELVMKLLEKLQERKATRDGTRSHRQMVTSDCGAARHDATLARQAEILDRVVDVLDGIQRRQEEAAITSERLHQATRSEVIQDVGRTRHAVIGALQPVMTRLDLALNKSHRAGRE